MGHKEKICLSDLKHLLGTEPERALVIAVPLFAALSLQVFVLLSLLIHIAGVVREGVTRGRHTDTRTYPGAPEEYTATPRVKAYSSSAILEKWREGSSYMPTVSRTGLKEEND